MGSSKRLTVDIDDDLATKAEAAARALNLTMREFTTRALAEALRPSARFLSAQGQNIDEYVPLLVSAQEEIILAGRTLRSVQDRRVLDCLGNLVTRGIKMTFLTCDDEYDERAGQQSPPGTLYLLPDYWPSLQQEVRRTHAALQAMLARSEGDGEIQILVIPTPPRIGFTMLDPLTPQSRVRLGLHLHENPGERQPFIEASATREDGQTFCADIMKYYVRLTKTARIKFSRTPTPSVDAKPANGM